MAADPQKNRVYSWENEHIAPKDKSKVAFENTQMLVNYIWENEGLKNPPKVVPMPKNDKTALAKANRMEMFVRETIPTWVVLHELSHSLTCTFDGDSDLHGSWFVGMYMKLVEKYLGIPLPVLMYTAKKSNVEFEITAKPIFLL